MIHSLFQPWRKATAQTLILSLSLILSLTLSACSDTLDQEENAYGTGELICFSISDGQTRADVASTATPGKVLKLRAEGTNDSLYLNPTVSDFCASDLTGTNDALTRGTALSSSSLPASLQVLSMIQKQTGKASAQCFFDQTYTKNSSDVYSGTRNYFWPGSDWQLDFYVVNDPDVTIDRDNFTFTYEVPSSISDQKDLLATTAKSISGSYNSSVPLSFEHACTAIQFKVENIPSTASLKSITLKGVQYKGTYSFNATTSSPWTLESATTDFTLSNGTSSLPQAEDGTVYTNNADNSYFMMLPQEFGEDSEAEVEVVLGFTGGKSDITYKASLAGTDWAQGKIVKYAISIDADYVFELSNLSSTVDAHYIIESLSIGANNFLDGKDWMVSVNNGATIQYAEKANSYVQSGYWTDRYINSSGGDLGSARGDTLITGSDTQKNGSDVYILIPENSGTQSRDITVSIWINNKLFAQHKINQLAAVDGWEQIDEGAEGEFGFNWKRVANYIYPYTVTYLNTSNKTYCQSVIDDNGASSYASVKYYSVGVGLIRYYIQIDYTQLSNIKDITSDDGHWNTIILKDKAGTAATNDFENVLLSILKQDDSGDNAFRIRSTDDPSTAPKPDNGETNSNTSAAIGECLKKNKYNLTLTTTTVENNITIKGYTPTISDSDIHWYLPAVDEFNEIPTNIQDPITPTDCWSSTIADEDNTKAKNGKGGEVDRSTPLHIRTKRK